MVLDEPALELLALQIRPRDRERHLVGRMDAGPGHVDQRPDVLVGREPQDQVLAPDTDPAAAASPSANRVRMGSSASMGARRYTPVMGAVETMEDFFEKLNAGDREGAVSLMDEKTEMRVHVGDNVQTLRGVERVGGWFLRGDKGLRMIPGEVRDTGTTYEADLMVVRPGAPSQHIDATFRVEAGRITAINIAPRTR